MTEHYDILSIYDFYNDLNIKINNLLNYCIKYFNDEGLFNDIFEIKKLYKSLVMDKLNNIN